jgi:nucleoside phosphorylase
VIAECNPRCTVGTIAANVPPAGAFFGQAFGLDSEMSDYVIVVPKLDELNALRWAFQLEPGVPDKRTPSGIELYRRDFRFGQVTFALLDKQTNTYSSILTAEIIASETPRLIFLTGTALGHPAKAPIGSVLVSDGVIDISEKRYGDDGREIFVPREHPKSDELTLDAKGYIARSFDKDRAQAYLRSMARKPILVRGTKRIADFIEQHDPSVMCETIVSGNEYRMGPSTAPMADIWGQAPKACAYDMEAAGFALAASISKVHWLVVRGISDHGTTDTKSEYHRTVAAGLAGRFLFNFLDTGLARAARLALVEEPATTLPQLRDEAYRLDGSWVGAMAYLDDNGDVVVFCEEAEFVQEGVNVQGVIKSRRFQGSPRHDTLEYRVSFSIARHGHAGGVWSETVAARRYFGVMLGVFDEDSTVLAGTWLGTHRLGVRRGFFKWYNTTRDGQETAVRRNPDELVAELISSFTDDRLQTYNDACRVAS